MHLLIYLLLEKLFKITTYPIFDSACINLFIYFHNFIFLYWKENKNDGLIIYSDN